jgi:hypothetical protein
LGLFHEVLSTVRADGITYSWNLTTDKQAWGFVYDSDIYFSVPYQKSTKNNRLLKLDTGSMGWTVFDIALNAPIVDGGNLLFGSPDNSNIFSYPVGDNDNGAAINSYWKSKDFVGADPYVEKQYEKISLIAGSDFGSSLDVTYTMDTATSTTYSVSLTSNTSSFLRDNRQLPLGETGAFFNLQVGNNAADQPWTFFGAKIDYKDDPWTVTE